MEGRSNGLSRKKDLKIKGHQIKLKNVHQLKYKTYSKVNSCPEKKERCLKVNGVIGEIATPAGTVPLISTKLTPSDVWGAWKVRWGIHRMQYKVDPGVYAVGSPGDQSPVLVTANYKLTFDSLRKELSGLDLWVLVLDTKGINVWCAAGKGSFGTKELIYRIRKTGIKDIVGHRTLILPQLGAPGISAHEVTRQTGFKVHYGPIRAKDIKAFIDSGMKATREMRTQQFNMKDRLVLTPMEFVGTLKSSMIIFGVFFFINLFTAHPFGIIDLYAYIGALIAGCVLTPALLPWIPGRAFAFKGWVLGLIWAVFVNIVNEWPVSPSMAFIKGLGYLLVLPAISAFYAMNFTGSSTYTSFSGVLKEMRIALPAIIMSIGTGILFILIGCL